MKRLATLAMFVMLFAIGNSQAGLWTWMGGSNQTNTFGNYGAMGIPAASNLPPARYAPAQFTDTAGNFWIFGGASPSGTSFSDLWRFDPQTNLWTWVFGAQWMGASIQVTAAKGVFSASNDPGALGYGMVTWVDKNNHFWIYGGSSGNTITSNLWQYNPTTNEWAWMGGGQDFLEFASWGTKGVPSASNTPGSRFDVSAGWKDNIGNLWLFGGLIDGSSVANDMWKYDISTGLWTWMSGADSLDGAGNYGSIGQPSVNYYPSARATNLYWQDSAFNFYLIGGENFGANQFYNDVWKFNSSSLEWTLLKGSANPDTTNTANANCQANAMNEQGGRFENRAVWRLCDQLIINYAGYQDSYAGEVINDLWAFSVPQNNWIKINQGSINGYYGALGVASNLNYPPARFGSCGFLDKDKNIWMFGGGVYDMVNYEYLLRNDLWRYALDSNCLGSLSCGNTVTCTIASPAITANQTTFCASDSANICAPAGYSTYLWNNGATTNCITSRLAGNYYLTVSDNNGCTAESNHLSITIHPLPPVQISVNGDTLNCYNAVTYQWYLNGSAINNATSQTCIATTGGAYSVAITDTNGCSATSIPVLIAGIDDLPTYAQVMVYPNPNATNKWIIETENLVSNQKTTIEIFDVKGSLVFQSEMRNPKAEIDVALSRGVYLLVLSSSSQKVLRKMIRL